MTIEVYGYIIYSKCCPFSLSFQLPSRSVHINKLTTFLTQNHILSIHSCPRTRLHTTLFATMSLKFQGTNKPIINHKTSFTIVLAIIGIFCSVVIFYYTCICFAVKFFRICRRVRGSRREEVPIPLQVIDRDPTGEDGNMNAPDNELPPPYPEDTFWPEWRRTRTDRLEV